VPTPSSPCAAANSAVGSRASGSSDPIGGRLHEFHHIFVVHPMEPGTRHRVQDSGVRSQGRGNLKLEIGNWKLGTRSLGQFPFPSFHFLPRPVSSFKSPVFGLKVDDRPMVGCDAGCGEGYGAAWALSCRSSWTAASAWGLVGSFTSPAWYWLRASALRPVAL